MMTSNKSTLYHYTTAEAFKKIIESGTLWFTHFMSLNSVHDEKTVRQKFDVDRHEDINAFVCCLSESRDDLEQWNSHGGHGRGFSIGFVRGRIVKEQVVQTVRVRYATDEISEVLAEALSKDEVAASRLQTLADRAPYSIQRLFVKDGSLKSEKEHRMVAVTADCSLSDGTLVSDELINIICFRDELVPYLVMELKKEVVVEVVLGPMNQCSGRAIQLYLRKHGYNNADVRRSATPSGNRMDDPKLSVMPTAEGQLTAPQVNAGK